MANNAVSISAMADQTTWIRLYGELELDQRVEARQAMLEQNPVLEDMYSLDDGIMEVLYFKNATASFCSFTTEPRTITF